MSLISLTALFFSRILMNMTNEEVRHLSTSKLLIAESPLGTLHEMKFINDYLRRFEIFNMKVSCGLFVCILHHEKSDSFFKYSTKKINQQDCQRTVIYLICQKLLALNHNLHNLAEILLIRSIELLWYVVIYHKLCLSMPIEKIT